MHHILPLNRREWLQRASCGFGYLALSALATEAAAAEKARRDPLAPKPSHFAPRAKRVIFVFMNGGPSHVDTFDYKPELQKLDGQPVPASFLKLAKKAKAGDKLIASPWKFARHGQGGLWISELFPHLAKCADDLCLINSMHCDSPAHIAAIRQMHTGATTFVRPSVGSWVLHGLGTENDSLPGFVTIGQLGRGGGAENRASAFLPASCQGTSIGSGEIANLKNERIPRDAQQQQLLAMHELSQLRTTATGSDAQFDGVIDWYELAFRMQAVAPKVMDLSSESPKTLALYGVGKATTDTFARNCILARRLAEAGVRFIEVGRGGSWDQHTKLHEDMTGNAGTIDQPLAALLTDLKQRGLLKDTLVIWGGEFGRLPASARPDGRDHNNQGYTMWMAGGGVRGGLRYGATDPFGFSAVENRVHIHDLHATVLHLLGLDHTKLTYRYSGRDFRLTDVHGEIIRGILA